MVVTVALLLAALEEAVMVVPAALRVAAVQVAHPTAATAGIHPVATRALVDPVVLAVTQPARTQAHSISQTGRG